MSQIRARRRSTAAATNPGRRQCALKYEGGTRSRPGKSVPRHRTASGCPKSPCECVTIMARDGRVMANTPSSRPPSLSWPHSGLRHDLGRAVEDDHVIGRTGGIARQPPPRSGTSPCRLVRACRGCPCPSRTAPRRFRSPSPSPASFAARPRHIRSPQPTISTLSVSLISAACSSFAVSTGLTRNRFAARLR